MRDKPSLRERALVAWLALWGKPVMFGFSGTITIDEVDDLEIRRRGGMFITWGRIAISAPAGTRIRTRQGTILTTQDTEAVT